MQSFYDRLGNILRDKLDSDEDPFDSWDAHEGKSRQAGNERERTPPPHRKEGQKRVAVPGELVEDFKTLGVMPGVSQEECKSAWKKLLKANHPDTNAQNPLSQTRSTQVSIKINNSYRRISHWYETGSLA